MKKFIFIPLIIILAVTAQIFLPWWSLAIVCFGVSAYSKPSKFIAFLGSFLAIFIVWYGKAMISDQNFDSPMAELLGTLFGGISKQNVFILTGLTGGITGGLSGLLGAWTQAVLNR